MTGAANVSPELRKKVLAAVGELGYKPNLIARGLASKSTRMLGLIVPEIEHPFYGTVADATETAAYQHGYVLLVASAHEDAAREQAYVEAVVNRWVDGLIFVRVQAEENVSYLRKLGLPVVVLDRSVGERKVPFVGVDNVAVGYKATKHLLDLGHRHILHLCGPLDFVIAHDRLLGYQQALKEAGTEADPSLCVECDYRIPLAHQTVSRLLDEGLRFTAIFAGSDYLAIGSMQAIQERGRHVPGDISVVGVDDIAPAALVSPPLTTVAQPLRQMAATSVDLLLKIIHGEPRTKQHVILPTRLVVRSSTGPAPGGS
jgi:LacI family transcriptional regulator